MAPASSKLIPEALVHTLAARVTCEAERRRRYGEYHGTKLINGVVLGSYEFQKTTGHRMAKWITARWHLGGGDYKEVDVLARSVKDGHVPENLHDPALEGDEEEEEASGPQDNPSAGAGANGDAAGANGDASGSGNHRSQQQQRPQGGGATQRRGQNEDENNGVQPVQTAHGVDWFINDAASKLPMNGPVPYREWGVRTPVGDLLRKNSDTTRTFSRLDYFIFMFPQDLLGTMVNETNVHLSKKGLRLTSKGEMLKFIGVIILATRFEFGSRRDLWREGVEFKYQKAPAFGRTGMSRNRFDDLWRFVRFSRQHEEKPAGMRSDTYRWLLVEDAVSDFNNHRAANVVPSDLLTVDESMCRWYGQGGAWINHGLPMYMAIDRKPENGCERYKTQRTDAAASFSDSSLSSRPTKWKQYMPRQAKKNQPTASPTEGRS